MFGNFCDSDHSIRSVRHILCHPVMGLITSEIPDLNQGNGLWPDTLILGLLVQQVWSRLLGTPKQLRPCYPLPWTAGGCGLEVVRVLGFGPMS